MGPGAQSSLWTKNTYLDIFKDTFFKGSDNDFMFLGPHSLYNLPTTKSIRVAVAEWSNAPDW